MITDLAVLSTLATCTVVSLADGPIAIDGIEFVDHGVSGVIDLGVRRGGLGVIDYDRDGYVDLIIGDDCGATPRLFHNEADPLRPGERTLVDRTEGSGFGDPDGLPRRPIGVLVADYDNDGDPDVYLIGQRCGDQSIGLLYRNDGGGSFANVSLAAGVRATGYVPDSASWNDFDLDGHVDLLVLGNPAATGRALLLRNQGDGTFADATDLLPPATGSGHCYSHLWTDYDDDGYDDCFVLWSAPKVLRNVAAPAGGRRFEDAEADTGFDFLGPAPMGIAAGDIDGDLDVDIAVSNASIGVYYENAAGSFGRIMPFATYFAWGLAWSDVDNDGDLDHFHCGSFSAGANPDLLFRNLGDGAWDDVSAALNGVSAATRYSVELDYDNDGRRDLIAVNPGDFVSVYQNVSRTGNHALTVHLEGDGRRVNGSAIGAVATVTAGGVSQIRVVRSGSSTTATEDLRLHFGLGTAAAAESIAVRWPRRGSIASRTEHFPGPFATGEVHTLRAGCPEDVDRDGLVAFTDLLALLAAWGPCADCVSDLDGDGDVGFGDLLAVLAQWGMCPGGQSG
ncbi:MAG: CRTAC1 family protein [Phycisphaerales bacterium]|nr:CRTAC1 family protein [Phycisphaerae bacterium]NNF43024.1 CRTAC1 family protein [Phycisphaerales bacterium]NNM25564.1 CRTAC1 family protein [Phycisphaerales bacterium]